MRILFFIFISFNLLFANINQTKFQKEILTSAQRDFIKTHPVIKVSNEKDWAPYDYNEKGEAKGYSIDYLNLLAKKIGVTFVFETDKWSNLLEKVKNKEIDLIHPLSINKTRKEFLLFSKPIIKNDLALVVSDAMSNIKSLDDLVDKTFKKNFSLKLCLKSIPLQKKN